MGSLHYTYTQLRKKDFAFFEALNSNARVTLDGITLQLAHATTFTDRLYFDHTSNEFDIILQDVVDPYFCTGHAHRQYATTYKDITIINPGSVGLPHDGNPLAKYALLDIHQKSLTYTLQGVPYDIRACIDAQFASQLIHHGGWWAKGVLYDAITGTPHVMHLLTRAEKIGDLTSEHTWVLAAQELGISACKKEILNFLKQSRRLDADR